ncbi:protein phosphatase 2C domain-containing protein [Barnesiella sp. An22]|uniref:PP2C family protein-serine/threonine phosphatase n=1 Tax=Barnesiella sp. An22 TaxID=1965590 RepID=UPI000B379E9D|nr:protein phosphatase 2C domain-containing protein [Barnesiella sp. An22]OUO96215.1 hypothetical protein B5F38_13355 [Barnesiella sp. An22]
MKSKIIFKMVAYTDAAGKFSADAPRNGNEDNFFFAYDLSKDTPYKGEPDSDTVLSDCGLLMVVADGMGGMNAGEVASQIAVDTVSDFFAPGKISVELAMDHQKRKKYMERVIGEADIRIKKDAKFNAEHRGMGSTIIMAWIVGDELTLSWCGDSRAYRYNPAGGIELLSKDHSYVQELADKGIIKYEDTFDHPQGNIITRSLGDVTQKAIPETVLFKVYNNDIILLCSDGLSGVLRDKKTYDADGELIEGENLEDIISANRDSLKKCREALWIAAEKADWYDNVTAVLCEIKSGAGTYLPIQKNEIHSKIHNSSSNDIGKVFKGINIHLSAKSILLCFIGLLTIVGMSFFTGWKFFSNKKFQNKTAIDSTFVGNQNSVQYVNISVNFENDRTELKTKLANIQKELDLQSNDSNITNLAGLITEAKDTIELSNAKHKIELLEKKVTFLKQIKEMIQKAPDSKIKGLLEQLYKKIYLSEEIKKDNWARQISEILKTISTPKEVGGMAESGNEEITEIVESKDTIIHDAKIQQDDTYESLIKFLEEKKFPGYSVSIVKEKITGRTLFNIKSSQATIDINTLRGKDVEFTLYRKK